MSETEMEKKLTIDLLGSKAVADSVKKVVDTGTDGITAFLSVICMPAATELGQLFKDKVSAYRQENQMKVLVKAEILWKKLHDHKNLQAHPRIVGAILENSQWEDSDEIQNMWAGLLATSCTKSGKSQENLLFINLLNQITSLQAKLLNYLCFHCEKKASPLTLLFCDDFTLLVSELLEITEVNEIHNLDMQIDHLRELGLLDPISGLYTDGSSTARVTPSAMALMLYVRSQGYVGVPAEFFGLLSKD
jgi:Abortive infection alpha